MSQLSAPSTKWITASGTYWGTPLQVVLAILLQFPHHLLTLPPSIPRDSATSAPSGSKQARRARGNTLEKETGNLIKRSNNGLCPGNQEAIELQAITEQRQRAEVWETKGEEERAQTKGRGRRGRGEPRLASSR